MDHTNNIYGYTRVWLYSILYVLLSAAASAQQQSPQFNVIGFYTAKHDAAHISYVREANRFFAKAATKCNFRYDSTNDWSNLNVLFLANYQVVLFLDTRPDSAAQREAFQKYMEQGGAWMGFHFAGFALTPSAYPQNWDWYHNTFLASGEYKGNTWRPTSAILRVEDKKHPSTRNIPATFKSSPNEWYSWKNNLRKNPDIKILLSIDAASFPLGTGPKQHEIWHSGDYPVAWTNTKYRMIYINMGHNDMDYGGTNGTLSYTFQNEVQNRFVLDGLVWLGSKKPGVRNKK
jgi:hypothetical protein